MNSASSLRLSEFSTALADLAAAGAAGVVAVRLPGGRSISGIVWRPGQVVTAAEALPHSPETLAVISATGTEHAATVRGSDPSTDVALLEVAGISGAALPAGDAAALRAGQFVLTVGRSPEHGPIVSFGAVALAGTPWHSQLGGRIDRLIRLGVFLTPAAEGAAVIDLDGRLLGMAVTGPRRTVLAIPTHTLNRVAEQLSSKGHVGRGYLGIAMQPVVLPEAVRALARGKTGLLVSNVDPRSSAAAAGVLLGDVITAWNGSPISDYRQVRQLLGPDAVGSTVTLTVLRAGALTELRLTVGERPVAG
jgi:S1-C subfamily serine protease